MRKITILILIACVQLSVFPANSQDDELSDLYTQHAISAFEAGDYDYASQLVDKALIFSADNADALYLKSVLIRDLPGSVIEYADLLKRCIAGRKLRYFDINEVHYNYGLINKRLMKYGDTIALMEKLDNTRLYTNSRFIRLYTDALIRSGKTEKARNILKESVRYFHDDSSLWSMLMEIDRHTFEDIRSQLIFHKDIHLPDLYEPVLRRTSDPVLQQMLIDKYYDYGQVSWEMQIHSYLLYPRISWWEIRDILSVRMPENRYEVGLLYQLAQKNDLMTDFAEFWQHFSGILQNDVNNDGFVDSIEEFKNGQLHKAIFDTDQDGDPESLVILDKDSVRVVFQDGIMQEIRYGVYPFVASVKQYSDNDMVEEYIMRPGNLKADILDMDIRMLSRVKVTGKHLDKADMLKKVLYVNTLKADSRMREKTYTYYPFGIAEEFIYGNNQVLCKTYYSGGIARKSEYDNDYDGYAESEVFFRDGKAYEICSDLNKNGVYEYKEYPADGDRKYWDLNEDGVFDICEYRNNNDIMREFSTQLNGSFDISLRVRKNDIIEIFRCGVKQKLTSDSYGQIWIGDQDSILFPDASEGVFIIENKQYYIFTYKGKHYIEGIH
ncbi:MAG: hypothetical protein JW874_02265 [Spirochaetales bacterium]|nr:hypothetical protein [Spirochaetales bacterium]